MATFNAHVPTLEARSLAHAVIVQAVKDALDPTAPPQIRHDAEEFLSGDAWFGAWCEKAGLVPRPLMSRRHS